MAHITALALVPAAPPGFPGAMAWSPSHACAPDIMGNSRPGGTRLPLTPGVINPNRGPGLVTRVITRYYGLLTSGPYRGVGRGGPQATGP